MADYQLSYTGAQVNGAIGMVLNANETILSTAIYSVGAELPFKKYPTGYSEVLGRLAYAGTAAARAYGTPSRFQLFSIKFSAPQSSTSPMVIYCASLLCNSAGTTVTLEKASEISVSTSGAVTVTNLESIQIGPLYGVTYPTGSVGRDE